MTQRWPGFPCVTDKHLQEQHRSHGQLLRNASHSVKRKNPLSLNAGGHHIPNNSPARCMLKVLGEYLLGKLVLGEYSMYCGG